MKTHHKNLVIVFNQRFPLFFASSGAVMKARHCRVDFDFKHGGDMVALVRIITSSCVGGGAF